MFRHRSTSASAIAAIAAIALLAVTGVPSASPAAASPSDAVPPGRRYVDPIFSAVDVTEGVIYSTAPSLADGSPETLRLDAYRPKGDATISRPAIVFIHGGGFRGGSREMLVEEATKYAERGFVTVSIDYRLDVDNVCQLLQDGKLPPEQAAAEQIVCENAMAAARHDAQAAVRWVREHATTLGVDPVKVAAIGFSAGAVTAADLAYRPVEVTNVGGAGEPDSRVQAAIAASGCEYEPSSIGAGDAPMFFLHAEFDQAVPFACAQANAGSAQAADLPVETMFYFGESTHARSLYIKYQADVDARWTAFLGTYLGLGTGRVPAGSQTIIHGEPNRSAVISLVTTDNVASGFVQVLPCGATPGGSSNLNADQPLQTRAGLAVVRFDGDGEACLYNQSATNLVADLQGYFTEGAVDDVADVRLVDTRTASAPRLAAGSSTQISGRPGSTGIVSIVVTDTTAPGYVQVLPCGSMAGGSSNVNADRAGQTIADLAFVRFDSSGHACVYNQSPANVVVDLQAYLSDGSFDDIDDVRALDTRTAGGGRPPSGTQTTVHARGSSTAVVSLIATEAGGAGFVQALSCDETPGGSSNVNVDQPGQTIANLAFVDVAADGTFCLYEQTTTHLVADVQGYLDPAAFDDRPDVRLLDTRTGA